MKKNKFQKQEPKIEEKVSTKQKVKMKFSEHKFYDDLNKPIFEKGLIYELEGAEWIQRWIKRGGEIVETISPGCENNSEHSDNEVKTEETSSHEDSLDEDSGT